MSGSRPGFGEQLRVGLGFPRFLARPLTSAAARDEVVRRIDARDANFLAVVRTMVFANPQSPYLHLLRHAGCAYADLEAEVRRHGLEATLISLRDAGVRVSLEELRGQRPIERPGLHLNTSPTHFDRPLSEGSWNASSSGSSGSHARVPYSWEFLADEAANEMLLFESLGIADAPGAFWMPALPSISGIHNLMLQLRFRRPPLAWFSHLRPNTMERAALSAVSALSLPFGLRAPHPEHTPLARAREVARWLTDRGRRGRTRYLKAFTSSAVRVAQSASELDLDLRGTIFLCGGEPLTASRRSYLEANGGRAVSRYVSTESGLIAGACGSRESMHLYTDRLAVIEGAHGRTAADKSWANSAVEPRLLLFTSLLPSAGKILLNASLGDYGTLSQGSCSCPLGRAGLRTQVSNVRSGERHTGEGMSLMITELEAAVSVLLQRCGGSPADFQLRESMEPDGLNRITITIHPRIRLSGEDRFVEDLYHMLAARGGGWTIVAETWRQANTLRVSREDPVVSQGFKQSLFAKSEPAR